MSEYLSDKIRLLSLCAIVLVLYIHSDFHDIPNEIHGMMFNHYLQEVISRYIGRLAVPTFFMISGYLFFRNCHSFSDVWIKMKRRVRTLLVPYLIACLFLPTFYVLMMLVPGTLSFVNSADATFFEGKWYEVVTHLFWDSGNGVPYAFHLWFLRNLIVIVVTSPLLFALRRFDKHGFIVLPFLMAIGFIHVSILTSFFWFMLGAYALDKMTFSIRMSFALLFAYVCSCLVEITCGASDFYWLNILVEVAGIAGVWSIYNYVVSDNFRLKRHRWLSVVCGFTFFVYLFHEPTLNIVRKLLVLPFGHSSIGFAGSYVASPLLFTLVFVLVGMAFKKMLPRVYAICVGGR